MEQFCSRFGNFVNSKKWATPKEARTLRRRRLNILRQRIEARPRALFVNSRFKIGRFFQ
jgi:hypothetical protein